MKKSFEYGWWGYPLLAAALIVAGCVSTDTLVPPVDPTHANAPLLTEGRRVYLRRCTPCHAPEPVNGYTFAEWKVEVADMREDAKLKPDEEQKLMAYLRAYSLKEG
jgi:mono/diheme cytochrome c family protein